MSCGVLKRHYYLVRTSPLTLARKAWRLRRKRRRLTRSQLCVSPLALISVVSASATRPRPTSSACPASRWCPMRL
eukprot:3957395-Pyramimonas_sp.AAC.1